MTYRWIVDEVHLLPFLRNVGGGKEVGGSVERECEKSERNELEEGGKLEVGGILEGECEKSERNVPEEGGKLEVGRSVAGE